MDLIEQRYCRTEQHQPLHKFRHTFFSVGTFPPGDAEQRLITFNTPQLGMPRIALKATIGSAWRFTTPTTALFAGSPLDKITPVLMRKIVNGIAWTSPIRRKGAIRLVTSLLTQAVNDELILRNPANSIPPTRVTKREIDPFSREEADELIAKLYEVTSGLQTIYACFFEFSFYTGMRPGEAMALRWSEVDTRSKRAKVCRIRLYGKTKERTQTKGSREVLLNDRALQALEKARLLTAARSDYVFAPEGSGERSELYIRSETGAKRYWLAALRKIGMRYRRMYDTRHTYATMCLMSGMNPAFIAAQLGHSVQVLLSTYAKWISSSSDFAELEKLDLPKNGTKLVLESR